MLLFFSLIKLIFSVSALFIAQPAGVPEILKKSLHSCSVRGGEEVFIIGKNFLKDTKVIFQENVSGNKKLLYYENKISLCIFWVHAYTFFSSSSSLCSR